MQRLDRLSMMAAVLMASRPDASTESLVGDVFGLETAVEDELIERGHYANMPGHPQGGVVVDLNAVLLDNTVRELRDALVNLTAALEQYGGRLDTDTREALTEARDVLRKHRPTGNLAEPRKEA